MNTIHSDRSQVFDFVIGVGLVGVIAALWQYLWLGDPLAPVSVGEQLKTWLIAAGIAVGGHELAHWVWAQSCEYDTVEFTISDRILRSNLLAIGVFVVVLIGEHFAVFDLGPIVAFGIVLGIGAVVEDGLFLSPGAVYVGGKDHTAFCHARTALAGPLWNAVVGLGIWLFIDDPTGWVWAVMLLSLWLAALNSLPFGPLDGAKVWKGEPRHRIALLSILVLAASALLTL